MTGFLLRVAIAIFLLLSLGLPWWMAVAIALIFDAVYVFLRIVE